jgi:hypothetical protein
VVLQRLASVLVTLRNRVVDHVKTLLNLNRWLLFLLLSLRHHGLLELMELLLVLLPLK